MERKIGIIGGSGFDNTQMVSNVREYHTATEWGVPSSSLIEGIVAGVEVVFLARHGRGHTLSPSKVNYRANVQALKDAGCSHILVTTAVGSLREEIGRGDLVIVDQFIDFTRGRQNTYNDYFRPGSMGHVGMATPFDEAMRQTLVAGCKDLGFAHHPKGTVITIEGPRFSTRAESHMFRSWGADIINMSIATECALAAELELPYAAVGMSTDYDCWKEDEKPVTWEDVSNVFKQNVDKVEKLLCRVLPKL